MGDIDTWHLELHMFFHQFGTRWCLATAQTTHLHEQTAKGCWTKTRASWRETESKAVEKLRFVRTWAHRLVPTDCLITVGMGDTLRQQLIFAFSDLGLWYVQIVVGAVEEKVQKEGKLWEQLVCSGFEQTKNPIITGYFPTRCLGLSQSKVIITVAMNHLHLFTVALSSRNCLWARGNNQKHLVSHWAGWDWISAVLNLCSTCD